MLLLLYISKKLACGDTIAKYRTKISWYWQYLINKDLLPTFRLSLDSLLHIVAFYRDVEEHLKPWFEILHQLFLLFLWTSCSDHLNWKHIQTPKNSCPYKHLCCKTNLNLTTKHWRNSPTSKKWSLFVHIRTFCLGEASR